MPERILVSLLKCLIMDYKLINPNGSPFSWQETKEEKQAEQSQQISSKLINMLISLFK